MAARIGAALKVDAVLAEQSPADKIETVPAAGAQGTTVMVGDGINDAPALAAADVTEGRAAHSEPVFAKSGKTKMPVLLAGGPLSAAEGRHQP